MPRALLPRQVICKRATAPRMNRHNPVGISYTVIAALHVETPSMISRGPKPFRRASDRADRTAVSQRVRAPVSPTSPARP